MNGYLLPQAVDNLTTELEARVDEVSLYARQYFHILRGAQSRSFAPGALDGNRNTQEDLWLPGWRRVVSIVRAHHARATALMLTRLEKDYDVLIGLASGGHRGGLGRVQEVSGGLSDPHDGGQAVRVLTFESGHKVVYKPRDVTLEVLLNRLQGELTRQGHLQIPQIRIAAGPGYGWSSFIDHKPWQKDDEATNCCRLFGALMAISYLLGGTDLHADNIVISGPNAHLVDFEVALHRQISPIPLPGDGPGSHSALSSGMLPVWNQLGHDRAVDVSALSIIRKMFEDLVSRQQGDACRRMLTLDWSHLERVIGQQFELTMAHLTQDGEICGESFLWGLDAASFRTVPRPTRVYEAMLRRSLQPRVLAERDGRVIAVNELQAEDEADSSLAQSIVAAERRALLDLDIPRFTLGLESTSTMRLRESGRLVGAVPHLPKPSQAFTGRRTFLRNSGSTVEAERVRQALRDGTVLHPRAASRAPTGRLDHAVWAARRLMASSYRDGAGVRSWISPMHAPKAAMWTLSDAGEGLYQGRVGIAVFFGALARATGDDDFALEAAALCEPAITRIREYTALTPDSGQTGLGDGLGGLLWGIARVARDLNRPDLAHRIVSDAVAASIPLSSHPSTDLMQGISGLAVGIASLASVVGGTALERRSQLLRLLTARVGGDLDERTQEPPLHGAAHGAAGVTMALALTGASPNDRVFKSLANKVLNQAPEAGETGWCTGAVGLGVAHLCLTGNSDSEHRASFDQVVMAAGGRPRRDNLCCGTAGAIDFLLEVDRSWPQLLVKPAISDLTDQLVTRIQRGSLSLPSPPGALDPGLFTGLAGIGYAMLRLGDSSTRSLLLLQ